jgi:hypothetical protein
MRLLIVIPAMLITGCAPRAPTPKPSAVIRPNKQVQNPVDHVCGLQLKDLPLPAECITKISTGGEVVKERVYVKGIGICYVEEELWPGAYSGPRVVTLSVFHAKDNPEKYKRKQLLDGQWIPNGKDPKSGMVFYTSAEETFISKDEGFAGSNSYLVIRRSVPVPDTYRWFIRSVGFATCTAYSDGKIQKNDSLEDILLLQGLAVKIDDLEWTPAEFHIPSMT